MRASQELRWKQSVKENEERRRRYEEASRRIENEQRSKAQELLERRRLDRARMDELMRNPAQQPAPPTKPILRKGAGAVLRTQATATAAGSHAATQPPAGTAQTSDRVRLEHEVQRREWSEGLKRYIARQREALKAVGVSHDGDQADALSWQELKLAAEAGFEELLRHQEEAAASHQPGSAANTRCPGMLRSKGGGAVIKPPAASVAAVAADAGVLPAVMPAPQPAAATAAQRCSQSGSSSPTSKWALRMKQMLDNALQNTSAGPECIPSIAAALPSGDHAMEQAHMQEQQSHWLQHQELLGTEAEQQQLSLSLRAQTDATESEALAAAEEGSCGRQIDVPEVLANKQMACIDTPEMQAGGESPHRDSSSLSAARSPGAGSIQQMSASAQIATAALHESMEKLHRATDVMLSAARHSQNAATITAAAASRSGTPAPDSSRGNTGLSSPVSYSSQAATEQCSADANVVGYGAAGCLLDAVAASPASNQLTGAHSDGSSPQVWLGAEAMAPSAAEPYHTHHSIGNAATVAPMVNSCMSDVNDEVLGPLKCLHVADQTQGTKLEHVEDQPEQQQEVEHLKEMQQRQRVEQHFNSAHQHVRQEQGQQLHQPLQQGATGAIEPGIIQPETAASDSRTEVARDDRLATTQQQQQLAAANAASVMDIPAVLAAAGQQQGAVEAAAAGPTLDSLLAEVQQLAALRKALKAEFVAMGHGNIAAAMGTLGLSKENGLSTSQLQPLQQLQPPVAPQEPARQQQVGGSVQEEDGLDDVEPLPKLPVCHLIEQEPSMRSVRQKETAQQAVRVSVEQQIKQLMLQLPKTKVMPATEQRPNMPMAVSSEAEAVAISSSLREQTLSQLRAEQADEVLVQQQALVQQSRFARDTVLQWSATDRQQFPAVEDGCLSAAKSATEALVDLTSASDGQELATSLPCSSGKSELMVTLAGAPMDLSFSFGLAAAQQQHDVSHPASPQLMPEGKQVARQLEPSHSAITMQACTQQEDRQLDLASWQKQQQQQLQLPPPQAMSANQAQQTRLQQQQLEYQASQLSSGMNQTAVEPAPAPLPALLQWNLPTHIKAPAAAAAATTTCVQAQEAMMMPVHLGLNGVPLVLPAEGPLVSYIEQQAGLIKRFVPAVVQPAVVVAVKPCNSNSSSLCPSPTPAVVSSWITGSPKSTRQGSPVPSPGRIRTSAAAVARNPASSSPTTAPAGAKRSGSGFLDKLSKQASSSRNSPSASGAASAGGKPTSAGARGLPAAERQLVNHGSYLTAALQAKQRMEKDRFEQQRLEAVAAATKQAAARKLQQLAAAPAGQQVAPAAMCSYAHSGTEEQWQQQNASDARSPGQLIDGSSTPHHASCTQPSPPAVLNSSLIPPRRVVRAASIKQVSAAGRPVQPLASRVAHNSGPGSGLSSPSQPASRIPSAPGTPLAKPASPTLPGAQQRPIRVQPPDCSTWTSGATGLADCCNSDFDHLERELDGVDDQQLINTNMPPSKSHAAGTKQTSAAATVPLTSTTPAVRVQKAIEAAVAAAATGNKQGMWWAVQTAAAAAMNRNAAKQQSAPQQQQAPAVAAPEVVDSRPGGVRPATLHIPASAASSAAATPAPVTAAATATGAAKLRVARTLSPVPSRQAQQQAASGQQQQRRQRSGAQSATSPKVSVTVKEQAFASAAPVLNKAPAAAANACMLEVHRLSLEEAELLASLQQLDNMQAQVKQQTAYGGHAPAPVAVATGKQVEVQSAERHGRAAAEQSAKRTHGARAGNNMAGITVAGSRRGHSMQGLPMPDASWSALPTSSGQSAAGAVSKLPIPSPNKAKEQRDTKLAAARAPAAGVPSSRTSKAATPTAEATFTYASGAAAGPMHAAGVIPVGWPNPCQPGGSPIPMQPGQQYPQMPMPVGYIPPGFGHPAMAWCDMDAARQQPHGLGPHAAAALAAAAPAHFQQPGQFGMYGPPMGAALGSMNHVYPGQGMAQPLLYGQQQQQQMYWAAMQAQQYQQWRQQQQQLGVVYPGTAGGVMGYSETGALSQLQPPLSAPGGSQYMPGSPLLPTLHYQQTVMRNRTSTAGDSGDSSSGRSSDAGYGVLSAHKIGAIGKGQAMGWQQQQPGNADVWPPRGIEKVHVKGTVVAGNGRQGEKIENGTVHVYKPGLLL